MEWDASEIGGGRVPPNPTALVDSRSGRVTEVTWAIARAPVAEAMGRWCNELANSVVTGRGVGVSRAWPLSFVAELFALEFGLADEIRYE